MSSRAYGKKRGLRASGRAGYMRRRPKSPQRRPVQPADVSASAGSAHQQPLSFLPPEHTSGRVPAPPPLVRPARGRGPRARALLSQLPSVVPENRSDLTRFSVLAVHKKDDRIPLRVRTVWRLESDEDVYFFSFSQGACGTPRVPPHGPLAPARCIVGL